MSNILNFTQAVGDLPLSAVDLAGGQCMANSPAPEVTLEVRPGLDLL